VGRKYPEFWRNGARWLNFSIPAPLNPAGKPLFLLPRDLEAEPLAEGQETTSIAGKISHVSSLGVLLAIIYLTAQ
jgi:hypothetical protein